MGAASGLFDDGALLRAVHRPQTRTIGAWSRSGFLHDGLLHILFNMVFLYMMGTILEPAIGRLNFVVVYFVSLLAGSFGALLFQPGVPTIGASGAASGCWER